MASIGIDIGGTAIKAVRLGTDGAVEQDDEVPYSGSPEEMIEQVAGLVTSLRGPGTSSVGIGMAGLVRWPEGLFVWGPHVRGENLAIRHRLEELLALPVAVDNDANCAALAELTTGAAMGTRNAVVMTLGTGIGAGIIADGAIYRGGSFAGEAGHMTMIPDGDPCDCGRRGCWETLVAGRRFGEDARRIMSSDPSGILATIVGDAEPNGSFLGIAAAAGDIAARDAVIEAGRWLGRGVANLVAILDPEVIVVGGAAVAVGDLLLDTARDEAVRFVEGASHRQPIRIEVAQCGPRAGAIGAGLLAAQNALAR
jgi:glucokinase